MLDNIKVLCHSSIKIEGEKIIYFDPFKITEDYSDADYIFCTHSHYDHFSPNDIKRLIKENTKLVVTKDLKKEAKELVREENILFVEPDKEYVFDGLKFSTTNAYNIDKQFHPKENNWVRIYCGFR